MQLSKELKMSVPESTMTTIDYLPESNNDFILDHTRITDIAVEHLRAQFALYTNDPYITSRLYRLVVDQLPGMLKNMADIQTARNSRTVALTTERDAFVGEFMETNAYLYCEKTDKFFLYNGDRISIVNEDDILYTILAKISSRRSILMHWKRRTKTQLMQRIKSAPVFACIPESNTIQRIIQLFTPLLFSSRVETKYFLAIIGDSMHRKATSNIHILPQCAKKFISMLDEICVFAFGVHISSSIKYKYYDYNYTHCRILPVSDNAMVEGLWYPMIEEHALDILLVAAHYSARYESAELYLMDFSLMEDETICKSVCFLKDNSKEYIIEQFLNTYTESSELPVEISWKNIQYLWKRFLAEKHLPAIIFQQPLRELLLETPQLKNAYVVETDTFKGIFSKYLPIVDTFLRFWNETMVEDETEFDLEINEIAAMLRRWGASITGPFVFANAHSIVEIIQHYFPLIEICDNKYIQRMRCNVWDKRADILALTSIPENSITEIDSAYTIYCKQSTQSKKLIASKSYFDRIFQITKSQE